jgi:hypothetical protein
MKINKLPSNLEDIIFPLMSFSDKLILTGSASMYVMDIFKRPNKNTIGDIDFALTHKLTVDEITHIKDFFGLTSKTEEETEYEEDIDVKILGAKYITDKNGDSIPMCKTFIAKDEIEKKIIQLLKYNNNNELIYKIDIFNYDYLEFKNVLILPYSDSINIKVQHPSITWSHKSKLAFDPRVNASYKHLEDLKHLINECYEHEGVKNISHYYTQLKQLETLSNKIKTSF